MTELVQFELRDGGVVVAELNDDEPGIERAARDGGRILRAAVDLDQALDKARVLANSAWAKLQDLTRRPDELEVEFGLRLNAEAGAVIARAEAEGHLQVRLVWKNPSGTEP